MFREFDFIDLGSTLYTPSISQHLLVIAHLEKFSHLTSVVFCLEDAIKDSQLDSAIENISNFLKHYQPTSLKVFLRPHDPENLKTLLKLKGIEKIDGFALAKFGTENMNTYFEILNKQKNKYYIMPVIESKDMFDSLKLQKIKDFLLKQTYHPVVTLRIGGEDMFKSLGIKKNCDKSIHDFHISSKIFAELLSIFKPYDFNISAPVYNCLENKDIFSQEVKRDIEEGFFGKTTIHPDQVKICNELYKVSPEEFEEASEVLKESNEAIFRFKNKMCEPKAHNVWAKNILKRAKTYGITKRPII